MGGCLALVRAREKRVSIMRIAITGSTGLVGSTLIPFLKTRDCSITRVVRKRMAEEDVVWDPQAGRIDSRRLEGHDAVVHLAGESIAARRWTTEQKNRIRESRVRGTRLLCETLAKLRQPSRVLVSASAIG